MVVSGISVGRGTTSDRPLTGVSTGSLIDMVPAGESISKQE